jgi:hypothetical protein
MATESAIQQRVITEINKCRETIRQARLTISQSRNKITSLRNIQATNWSERQIHEILPRTISENEEKIETAETRINDLQNGNLRREIIEAINTTKQRQRELEEKKINKAEHVQQTRQNQRRVYDQWRDGERQSRREIGREKGDLRRGEQYFWRITQDFDSKNMAENLKRMPNNRGYRYRGVNFYGELDPEIDENTGKPKPTILTESSKGTQLIHEISEDSHKIFKKIQRGRRVQRELISETPRRRIGRVNLLDYMV